MMIKKIFNFIKEKLFYFLIGGVALASTIAIIPDDLTSTELIQRDGIEEVLKDKTHKEKVEIKSKELSKVEIKDKFIKKGIEIEIIGDIKEIEGGIELFATAYKNGKQLGFGKDGSVEIERFRFFNPPLLVDDEAGDIIREWKNKEGETKQRKLRYDPEEAIKQTLEHTILKVAKDGKNIIKGKIGNTTSTFYPSLDGLVEKSNSTDWATTRDATDGESVDKTATSFSVNVRGTNPIELRRGYVFFDTSGIGTDTIDSAVLSLYVTESFARGNSGYYTSLVEATPASDTDLTTADYDELGTTKLAGDLALSSGYVSPQEFQDFTLNATGEGVIDKSGKTTFGLRNRMDILDNRSTVNDMQFTIRSSDYTGTTSDPKLVVEHSAPVSRRIIMVE